MNKGNLNFIFWGTPEVASETLEILKKAGYLPSLVITAPDKPQGRKMLITLPPVKVWAIKNKIQYLQPEKLKKLNLETDLVVGVPSLGTPTTKFDLFIVVAYGKIIPEEILNLPKLGSINIHYSLLPKYRGASPVESAILNGDKVTGVSVQKMNYKMDTGSVIAVEKVEIDENEKAPKLRKRLIKIGGELLVRTLPNFINGRITETVQNESQATYCKKIKKGDGLVDLEASPPSELYNKFRAYSAWPRIFFFRRNLSAGRQERIIITDASLEDGQFVIKNVLPEGKKETIWEEFKRKFST